MKSEASRSNEYRTPDRTFRPLDARYRFNLDVAAARWNARCADFFTKRDNALKQHWFGRAWMNCPYTRGNLDRWMEKARREVFEKRPELVGCLVPAYTGEGWWHDHVEAPPKFGGDLLGVSHYLDDLGATKISHWPWLDVSVTFLRGRVGFEYRGRRLTSARFSSAFVVFAQPGVLAHLGLPVQTFTRKHAA